MAGAVMSTAVRWLRNRAAAQSRDLSAESIADMDAAIAREDVGRCCCVVLDEFLAASRQQSAARQRHVLEHAVLLCSDWLHSTRPSTVARHNRIFRLRQALAEQLDTLAARSASEMASIRVVRLLRDLAGDAV